MKGKPLDRLVPVRYRPVIAWIVGSNLLAIGLFALRYASTQTPRYSFLIWNLFLAYLPLLIAVGLRRQLRLKPLLSPLSAILFFAWLALLPNSFYLASDLIHLQDTGEIGKLFDATMFLAFIFSAYLSGFLAVYLLHGELIRRFGRSVGHSFVALTFLACGFAIYLGRYMRWNSWDIFINPMGVIFDVSEPIVNPVAYPESLLTTATFFLLLGTMYGVIWHLIQLAKAKTPLGK